MGDEHPDYLAVAFDLGRPTVRLEKYAEYKAGRAETPTDFTSQLGLIDEVLDTLHVPMVRVVDHEADDAIGTLANARHRVRAGRRDRDRRPRLLPARPSRDPGDVQPARHLRHRPVRRGGRGGALRRSAVEVPRVRGVEGRPVRQHPGRPRGGGEDRGEADPAVRLGRGAAGARRRAAGEAEGQRPRGRGSAGAEQGAGADRHGPPAGHRSRGLRAGGVGPRRGAAAVHVARVPLAARPAGRDRRDEAEGGGDRTGPPRDIGGRARADDRLGRTEGCSPGRRPPRGARGGRVTGRRASRVRAAGGARDRWPTRWRPPTRRSGRTTRRSWSAGRSPRGWRSGAWCSTRSSPATCWIRQPPNTPFVR